MITINLTPYDEPKSVLSKAAKKLGVKEDALQIYKKSIDARRKNDVKIVYSVGLKSEENEEYSAVDTTEKTIIVGSGPAGLFCALTLCRHGIKPIIIERGSTVEKRSKKVESFFKGGELDTQSNVQFGEGGAGTFSDGKLNTGVNNRLIGRVLRDFVSFGAPEDITYLAKPHIGSDKLKSTIINMRKHIESLGGRFIFDTQVTDFNFKNGRVYSVAFNGVEERVDNLVLAIGHSARDTFETLFSKGVMMEQKEFAVGLRIEQLQSIINKDRYGKFAGFPTLPPAEYKLVSHARERGVFTFCMCPGGVVVPAGSEEGLLAVNGMSDYLRDGENANSAVIAQIKKSDFETGSPLSGLDFQRKIEKLAFSMGGGNFIAPIQLAEDFINDSKTTSLKDVKPTYSRGFAYAELSNIFPKDVSESLKAGLVDMDAKIKGFASSGAVLTGVESRTSSPLRILRGEDFQSVNVKGLYPCGEGCGYAGGIMSAAVDGILTAESIASKYLKK